MLDWIIERLGWIGSWLQFWRGWNGRSCGKRRLVWRRVQSDRYPASESIPGRLQLCPHKVDKPSLPPTTWQIKILAAAGPKFLKPCLTGLAECAPLRTDTILADAGKLTTQLSMSDYVRCMSICVDKNTFFDGAVSEQSHSINILMLIKFNTHYSVLFAYTQGGINCCILS